jgi:DNA replication and repair protein RecF
LRHFRNYEEAFVEFAPRVNAICGDNAQGKTNLLEAISLVSTGRSFRTQHLSELIREGSSFFYLEAEIVRTEVSHTLKLSFDGQTKKLQIDANSFAGYQPLLGILPIVLSTPDDIHLVSGSPAERRRFLNLHLAQSDPLYVHHLSRFWRAMKQRNCLLRTKSLDAIECWESEMAHSASYLSQLRSELIEEMKEPLARESRRLSFDADPVELRFHPSYAPAAYLQQLQKMRPKEKDLGLTLHGPHRDDLSFWIASKPARTFASEGQKRTSVSALRLAEWQRLGQRIGAPPLLAIDDFGGSLDPCRQKHLSDNLRSMGQVFVTTPSSAEAFPDARMLHIRQGQITI